MGIIGRSVTRRRALCTGMVAALVGGTVAAASPVLARTGIPATTTYKFTTHVDKADPTFDRLLGINDQQVCTGYFGNGSKGHPWTGYTVLPPYAQTSYRNETF